MSQKKQVLINQNQRKVVNEKKNKVTIRNNESRPINLYNGNNTIRLEPNTNYSFKESEIKIDERFKELVKRGSITKI